MALETERAFYAAQREELLRHYEGQFALIKGERLAGTFTTFPEAYEAGVEEFGLAPFLIERVTPEDQRVQIPALSVGMISVRS